MSGNLPYFMIREIIYTFLKRSRTLNESDIINTVLAELTSSKIIDSMDKTNLNFVVIYCIFDLLSALGFLFIKNDKGQKQLTWRGFIGFYEKNRFFFGKSHPAESSSELQMGMPNIYDSFAKAFFDKMFSQSGSVINYADYQQISSQFLYAGIFE